MNGRMLSFVFIGLIVGARILTAAESPDSKTLDGIVTPLIKQNIKMGLDGIYSGFIDYVRPEGSFFSGPVYDDQGNLVKNGDVLATINTDYVQLQYKTSLSRLDSAKADLEDKQNVFEINQKLLPKKAISSSAYVTSKADYLQALASYQSAEAESNMVKKILDDVCVLRAKFDGYVNEVKFSGGWANGKPEVINISQLDPIYIKIPIDSEGKIISSFTFNTPITIYPKRGEPIGVIQGRSVIKDGYLQLLVHNVQLPPPVNLLDKNGKLIPIIQTWYPVTQYASINDFKYDKTNMIVSKNVIFGTPGDYYVWCVDGAKTGIPGKGLDYINKVKKIKISKNDKHTDLPSYVHMITFKPKDNKINDTSGMILLSKKDCPSDLKEGDLVCLFNGMYTFMPEEKVKVEIGSTSGTVQ